MNHNGLPLIGLALRAGRLVMGTDAVVSALHENKARLILFAADISAHTRSKITSAVSNAGNAACLLTGMPYGKSELGGALGRAEVSVAALTDTGFASALMERLAAENPERYAGTSMTLKRKFQRRKERRASQAHRQKSPRKDTAEKQNSPHKNKPYQQKSTQGGKTGRPESAGNARRQIRPARTATGPPRKHSGESGGRTKRVPSRRENHFQNRRENDRTKNHPQNRRGSHAPPRREHHDRDK